MSQWRSYFTGDMCEALKRSDHLPGAIRRTENLRVETDLEHLVRRTLSHLERPGCWPKNPVLGSEHGGWIFSLVHVSPNWQNYRNAKKKSGLYKYFY